MSTSKSKLKQSIRGWADTVQSSSSSQSIEDSDTRPQDPAPKTRIILRSSSSPSSWDTLDIRTEADIHAVLLLVAREYPKFPAQNVESLIKYLITNYEGVAPLVLKWLDSESKRLEGRVVPAKDVGILLAACRFSVEITAKLVNLFWGVSTTKKERKAWARRVREAKPSMETLQALEVATSTIPLTSEAQKLKIVDTYAKEIVSSKVTIAPQVIDSYNVFLPSVSLIEIDSTIIPAFDKALLRSPELALPTLTSFLSVVPEVPEATTTKLLNTVLSNTKSANIKTREACIEAFKVLLLRSDPNPITKEILSLPLAGRTASADHRLTLFTMLSLLPPNASLIPDTVPLLAKETNEACLEVLGFALRSHLKAFFQQDAHGKVLDVLKKEMGTGKPAAKRVTTELVGAAIWDLEDAKAREVERFFAPIYEAILSGLPSNPTAGAVALLFRYDSPDKEIKNICTSASTTKPHFLVNDKVASRFVATSTHFGDAWLLRAIEGALRHSVPSSALGKVLLALHLGTTHHETRALVIETVKRWVEKDTEIAPMVVRDGLNDVLTKEESLPSMPTKKDADDQDRQWKYLSSILLASSTLNPKHLLSTLLIAHHPSLSSPVPSRNSKKVWIALCQEARIDPAVFVEQHLPEASSGRFADAAYGALGTVLFVKPELVVREVVKQLSIDLNKDSLSKITPEDLSIWSHNPAAYDNKPFIDVIATASSKQSTVPKKGKDAAMAKWDQETRSSLKTKAPAKLTPAQQQLVKAQLSKEEDIRAMVEKVRIRLVDVFAETLGNFVGDENEVGSVDGVFTPVSVCLLGENGSQTAADVWLKVSTLLTQRLSPSDKWIVGMGVLRASLQSSILGAEVEELVLPVDVRVEGLRSIVMKTLYKLHFVTSQAPLDSFSWGFVWGVVRAGLRGEIGLMKDKEGEEGDGDGQGGEPGEDARLSMDIVKFHSNEFSSRSSPSLSLLQSLLGVLKRENPNSDLGKEATGLLRDLGEGVCVALESSTDEWKEGQDIVHVLIESTLMGETYVRGAVLQTLQPFDLTTSSFIAPIWIACQDSDNEQNQILARRLWEDNGLDIPAEYEEWGWVEELIQFLGHDVAYVRSGAALALAEGLRESWSEESITKVLRRLEEEYVDKAKILAPEFDEFGMVIQATLDRADPFPTRIAVGNAFFNLAPSFPDGHIEPFFTFLISSGALGDRNEEVRRSMLNSASSVIDLWGSKHISELIGMFEEHLGKKGQGSEDDQVREAVVILFGRIARHLGKGDARLPVIVDRLVDALKTPAEQVQIAVGDCLSPLSKSLSDKIPSIVSSLLDSLFDAPKYAERRGAAYGLAGILHGSKKRYEPRQGTMFAFECLSSTLGRVFEPYIMHILPLLLASFGDDERDVREAGGEAARVIMRNLSGYGVKLILPTLLEGLEEKQWRSKRGSIELLGMMAYCSPRQLSLSLPVVIPRLTDVLTDSHARVREAANGSLKMFGEVIENPEVKTLVPSLLKALVDPARTGRALGSLLKTSFMHYIDNSSLALIVPIIERGLKERGAEVKKRAAQIVGNLASLTDTKDFVPYLATLLPLVHTVLVDPVPEARATAAKALGTLVERLGEHHFPDLVPGLLRTLKTDSSGVDRQGAAQGLSEVLAGLGMERLEGLLPDIIANAQSPRATYILPATFGARFQPHLPKIITPILSGLADAEEYVRDAAMRAGRMVPIDLLLPELERGMFDPGWRIRQSSITLVGELLFKVSGISGKTSDLEEEDIGATENASGEASKKALVEVLGQERRDRILAALYLVRQDAVAVVRQAAAQIWKALVYNTPKTVRELLPELLTQILTLISTDEFEQNDTASRTVAEVCRKFGEKIVGQIVPILQEKAASSQPRARQGVCLVICEIMENTTESQREDYESDIVDIVRTSLVDDEAFVRSAAAKAFDTLQEVMGTSAIDQTIPTLLEALRQPGKGSGTALQALKEVMSVRASTVFPVLIPTLTGTPMSVFNAHALASLVAVAGSALSRRLTATYEGQLDEDLRDALDEAIEAIMTSIEDAEGLNTLMLTLLGWAKNDSRDRRVSALQFFAKFCQVSEMDYSLYRIDWIRQLVSSLEDPNDEVYSEALKCAEVFCKAVPKDEMEGLVVPLRRTPGHFVPGFSLPKGVGPFLPIIIAGLTTGTHEQRENAAYCIGDLVERTEDSAIKPYVVPFTGPLIRVATQATTLPPAVKTAILSALTTMLQRIPQFVKPFFPQLQRTFVKSASDGSSVVVRQKAATALGVLMKNQPRVDPVLTELLNSAKQVDDDAVASSLIGALSEVVRNAHSNTSEPIRVVLIEFVESAFEDASSLGESYTHAVASLFSAMSPWADTLQNIVEGYLVGGTPPSVLSAQTILAVLEDETSSLFQELGMLPGVAQKVVECTGSDRVNIGRPSREARDLLRLLEDSSVAAILR
ncbi:armadillo-type protein [Flagelloscypha sp. PMI_526]|nr:armadillo-type protein [Flagelloscypha sp. PMI_526]